MPNKINRYFKSDNYSGIHPKILEAIQNTNQGHQKSYGEDDYTLEAQKLFTKIFQRDCKLAFTFNGTGTNVLALRTVLKNYNSVICASSAHINVDETGSPEAIAGVKILAIPTLDGKIQPQQIKEIYQKQTARGKHSTLPKLVSLTNASELGTVYSLEELKAIKEVCDELNLYLHIDACRIFNAVAYLQTDLAQITQYADLISFGGTKSGCMMAEALVVFNPEFWPNLEYLHKNTLQLFSKNRFIACQYLALFQDNLWLEIAKETNQLALSLASKLENLGIKITQKVQSNHVFIQTNKDLAEKIETSGYAYIWSTDPYTMRFVISFDNTQEDIDNLIHFIQKNS